MIYLDPREREHKEQCLRRYGPRRRQAYRERESVSDLQWSMIDARLGRGMRILDLGAGKKGMPALFSGRAGAIVGLDLSPEDLRRNEGLSHRVVGDARALPFPDGSFDAVTSQWLIEHLASPPGFFREVFRVLKPGGWLLVVSNSLFCPLMFFNAVTSRKLRDRLKRALLPREVEEDTFPTFYRANTRGTLRRMARRHRFREEEFVYANDLSFFIFNRCLFSFLLFFDRLTALHVLRPLRMHFLALYRKGRCG